MLLVHVWGPCQPLRPDKCLAHCVLYVSVACTDESPSEPLSDAALVAEAAFEPPPSPLAWLVPPRSAALRRATVLFAARG